MSEREALQIALDIFRSPALVRVVQRQPLPKNVLQTIRIAGGDALDDKAKEITFGWTEEEVRAAATFFLQQILFEKSSDAYRVLGLKSGAELTAVKDHKRALLKWLHPDRNANRWESVLLQRVVKASDSILGSNGFAVAETVEHEKIKSIGSAVRHQTHRRRKLDSHLEATRVKKFVSWKKHLFSFIKRMSVIAITAFLAFWSVRVLASSGATAQIEIVARSMLSWIK
jgi:hypothetical protein